MFSLGHLSAAVVYQAWKKQLRNRAFIVNGAIREFTLAACSVCGDPRSMRRKFLLWLLPIVLLAGCIEFERQTLTYSYNPATDTLKVFQDYHGIFGADTTNSLSNEELTQFDSVINKIGRAHV